MVFGGRTAFYMALVCLFCTGVFSVSARTVFSAESLKSRRAHAIFTTNLQEKTTSSKRKDTTYYKQVLDTTSSDEHKLFALKNLIFLTYKVDVKRYKFFAEQSMIIALRLKQYDLAINQFNYYMSVLSRESQKNLNYEKFDSLSPAIETYFIKIKDSTDIVNFLRLKARILSDRSNYEGAIDTYTQLLYSPFLTDSLRMTKALHNRGLQYQAQGMLNLALLDYQNAQKYFSRIQDTSQVLSVQRSINVLYGLIGLEEKSIQEMKKMIAQKLEWNKVNDISYNYLNLSVSYYDLKDYEGAVENGELALRFALKYSKKRSLVLFYTHLSNLYFTIGEIAKGKNLLDKTKAILIENNIDIRKHYRYQLSLSKYYLKTNRLNIAESGMEYLLRNVALSQEERIYVYRLLYQVYEAMGKYRQSMEYYKKLNRYKDSVFSAKKSNGLSYYQTLYETEKKEQEIEKQKLELQVRNATISEKDRQQQLLVLGLIGLVIILGGSVVVTRKIINQRNTIKEEQEKVEESLEEKELLLKEIHHRVGNNLQIVHSLLNKQSVLTGDSEFKILVEDAQNRIQSMAIVHRKLYQNKNLSAINLQDYILDIIENLNATFSSEHLNIQYDFDMIDATFKMDTAIPLGLILNELLTNAYKHAFENGEGRIAISLHKDDSTDHFILKIKDNGKGMPENLNIKESKSLGMILITGLCKQLKATFDYKNNNGSEFKILLQV